MREIKFRAWDDVAKQMYYSKTEQFDDSLMFRFEHFDTERPIYMQYTGLKDKNGKEIYEGDIIRTDHEEIGPIYWSEEWAMFGVVGANPFALMYWASESEVIGNIYENPDMLRSEANEGNRVDLQDARAQLSTMTKRNEQLIVLNRGDRVKHKKHDHWGHGTVTAISKSGKSVCVRWDNGVWHAPSLISTLEKVEGES